ncbi:hypothetical protein [Helicobacter suis]|uniref:hypothetical protein n=1 Tax=Helicobacter suis TaxID=104628 RepID=UPI0013D6AA89|nr:hypothetical protein [Helicobacter suis]
MVDGVFKPLIFAVFVSRVAHVEVGYARDSSVLVNPLRLSVLSIGSLVAGKEERRTFNAMFDAFVLGNTKQVLKRLAAPRTTSILYRRRGSVMGKSNLTILNLEALIAGKKIRRLFNARFDALVLGDANQVLKRLTTRNFSNILSYQYDNFVSKCQKHVKIHVPNMGSGVSPTSTFHASFHWKF